MNRIQIEYASALMLFAKAEGYKKIPDGEEDKIFLESQISRLGVTLMTTSDTNPDSMRNLNPAVTKAAAELHEHRIHRYTKDEAIAALKFIELTALYGYYERLSLGPIEIEHNDPLVEKTLKSAQKIWNHLDTKKVTRVSMTDELERLKKNTKKVLGGRLAETEQMFFRKYMEKALKILSAYAKQRKD